jgi:menaquinone-dependent protoporphyrinogen oxidase
MQRHQWGEKLNLPFGQRDYMTHILVVYGTTDGQTRKIAHVLAENLRAQRCSVDLLDAGGSLRRLSPEGYDGVIVAASVHIGSYQSSVKRWVRTHAAMLNQIPTAFLSVCLAVLEKDPKAQQEIRAIMQRFVRDCGWRPTVTRLVAGAVLYTRYPWLKKWMMRRIVAKAGGGTDTTRDYEYTDWNDLRVFAGAFARQLKTREAMAGGAPVS